MVEFLPFGKEDIVWDTQRKSRWTVAHVELEQSGCLGTDIDGEILTKPQTYLQVETTKSHIIMSIEADLLTNQILFGILCVIFWNKCTHK